MQSASRSKPWPALASLLFLLGLLVFPEPLVAQDDPPSGETAVESPGELGFVGRNLFAKAEGIFHEWRVVEASLDLAVIEDAFVVVEIVLDSVDTGIDRRDAHLRTADFFETETYPIARVRVHSPRALPGESAGQKRYSASFDIDLHGVQKTLEGEVVLRETDPIVFEGGLTLDRTDFGVGSEPSRWNPMAPKAEIPVHFRVEL